MNQVKVNREGFELRGSICMQISTKRNGNLGRVIWGLSQLGYTVAFAFRTIMYDLMVDA